MVEHSGSTFLTIFHPLQFVNQVKLIRYLRGSTQERRKQIALLFLLLRDLQKVLAIGRFDHQIMIFSHLDLI